MKICSTCKVPKGPEEFNKDNSRKCGLQSHCRECLKKHYFKNKKQISIKNKEYHLKNKEQISIQHKEYNLKNSERIAIHKKNYNYKNKEKVAAQTKIYRYKYKKRKAILHKERMKIDIQYRLSCLLRSRIYDAINGIFKSGSAVRDLGCTIPELKFYLEGQFQDGMTWENWSQTGWHIDHKIPPSFFDLTNREHLLQAVHYTNLQPMWADENLKKGGINNKVTRKMYEDT